MRLKKIAAAIYLTTMLVSGLAMRKILHLPLQVEWVMVELGGKWRWLAGTLKGRGWGTR